MRRALGAALVAGVLACNSLIGLGEPTVRGSDEGGEPGEASADGGAEGGAEASGESGEDVSPETGNDGGPDDADGAPGDSDAGDATMGTEIGPPDAGGGPEAGSGDALQVPARVYLVNAAQLGGIVICLGTSSSPAGNVTVTGALPYPQHLLTACIPRTCSDLAMTCGVAGDGCGGQIFCGSCSMPDTCGGGGIPGLCGSADGAACTPMSCSEQGVQCGTVGDGCGSLLDCGDCTAPATCGGTGMPFICGVGEAGGAVSGGGLMPGTGIQGPDMTAFGNVFVTGFVIPARYVPTNTPCSTLIGGDGQGGKLPAGAFYRQPAIGPGVFTSAVTTLVALWGCPPGVGDVATCGPTFDPVAGNLTTTVAPQPEFGIGLTPLTMGVQVANVSPALECSGCPAPSVGLGDASLLPVPLGGFGPPMPILLSQFQQDASLPAVVDNGMTSWQFTFDDIARASTGGSPTAPDGAPYFSDGQSYIFVVLGDPRLDAGGLHVVATSLFFPPDPLP